MKLNLITKISFTFVLFLASANYFYANDKQQAQAVELIRKEISRSIAQKNPSPIQAVLRRYKARDAFTFSGAKKENDAYEISNFLPKKRPLKIALSEWNALRKSLVTIADSENNSGSFTLLDLDEDGLRDLIVEVYSGGTGLYSYAYAYRQSGGKFVGDKTFSEASSLYSINGRGSDQAADWVRINGRVYLAYRNGEFGKDELFLDRAFAKPADKVKGLIVEYDYRHNLPRRQKSAEKTVILKPGLHAALQKGLNKISGRSAAGSENDPGTCFVPENLSAEQREEYESSWFGPGHYTFEVVADFPVLEGKNCYKARLINFKSSYLANNNYISTALWLLRKPDSETEEYAVESTRIPKRVKIADLEHSSDDDY
jgi:hypothetical protein